MKTIVNVRLALFAFVLLFSASITRAQNSPPLPDEKLTVVDSNGKLVGNVLGFGVCAGVFGTPGAVPIVSFRVEGIRIVLSVGAENFYTETLGHCFNTLWFTSTDCSEPAYVNHIEEGFEEGGVAPVVPLNFLLGTKVLVPYGQPTNVNLRSKLLDPETCESFPEEELSVTPLRALIDLSNHFTPPFSLK